MTQNLLSRSELLSVLAVTPTAKGGTIILHGKHVPWRPPTVAQFTQHVARFQSVQAFYTFGAAIGVSAKAAQAGEESPVDPDIDAYMAAQLVDGPLADAAHIAICIGAPGDAEIEQWLLGVPEHEFEPALTTIQHGTWQDDPAGFLGRVGRAMSGTLMRVMQSQSSAQTSSAPTTSTRTAGKATTSRSRSKATPKSRKRT
ncbi:hypothetical protein ASF49_08085 [Methylobacterium sp. Leaf104]|uniref:hypothetical protein n=1 Tax=Methylobacterium TaxID=407 RepID=UPI0006FE5BB5|nr:MULTISPECIES: hypothetical protein [Methylobacterium]KQP33816.1 hypothetical protein ASF49_08085 [Methylobacterium sp. Leaf104]MCI9879616.1 hypothetical protein [Methylobacterium goesingense]